MTCPACGAENRADARFCDACGAALGAASGERRRVVQALERYERKKNLAMAAQVRERLAELQAVAP